MKKLNPELEQLLEKVSKGEISLSTDEKNALTKKYQNNWLVMDEIIRAFCQSRIPKEKNIKEQLTASGRD